MVEEQTLLEDDSEGDSCDGGGGNTDTDSDPGQDELTGNDKQKLYDDINEAIDQFASFYNHQNGVPKKPVRVKNKKSIKDPIKA